MANVLKSELERHPLPDKMRAILEDFSQVLSGELQRAHASLDSFLPLWRQFLHELEKAISHPHVFAPYHQKIRTPFDYYRFGLDFLRPLVDFAHSKVIGRENWDAIEASLARGENSILFANHQTECDPQAISLLLEPSHPKLAESIIYVAGERVVTDPIAIPFSLGCDLLCIYSKRYIDHPAELKEKKQLHNREVMERMSRLLASGGKAIYVAPSGGRDRRGSSGKIEVAPFDPSSVEMFYLMAKKAKRPTSFYPLSLATYNLLPPPEGIQRELGESRTAHFTPIGVALGEPLDMEQFVAAEKEERRKMRATAIWDIVRKNYETL